MGRPLHGQLVNTRGTVSFYDSFERRFDLSIDPHGHHRRVAQIQRRLGLSCVSRVPINAAVKIGPPFMQNRQIDCANL